MGFQVYEKGSAPVPTTPSVTIQKRGLISINRAAYDLINRPEGVELLWDSERKAIALRPAELTNQNAYPVRPQVVSADKDKGPWLIAGTLFTQFIGLDTSEAFRWTPTAEDGCLVIDISQPGSRATSNRGRAAERAAEQSSEAAPQSTPTAPAFPLTVATGYVAREEKQEGAHEDDDVTDDDLDDEDEMQI